MLHVPTYLAPSGIHGIGVFAAQDIPKGMLVWEMTSGVDVVLTEEQIKAQPEPILSFLKRYVFTFKNKPHEYILCADNGRFVNHSDVSNLVDDEAGRDWAARLIKKGEEIVANYHTDFGPESINDWKPGDPIG